MKQKCCVLIYVLVLSMLVGAVPVAYAVPSGIFEVTPAIIPDDSSSVEDESELESDVTEEEIMIDEDLADLAATLRISLSYESKELVEGESFTNSAVIVGSGTISWRSSNTTVATVRSGGIITAQNPGTAVITATLTNFQGQSVSATCTVYVSIPNGIYRIESVYSDSKLKVYGNRGADYTDVLPYPYCEFDTLNGISNADMNALSQSWRITYLSQGQYCIRPMHKLDMGLKRYYSSVYINNIGSSNASDIIPNEAKWQITFKDNAYTISNNGYALSIFVGDESEDDSITLATLNANDSLQQWRLEEVTNVPDGILCYENSSGQRLTNLQRFVAPEESLDFGNYYFSVCSNTAYTPILWSSSNPTIATVEASTGVFTGVR